VRNPRRKVREVRQEERKRIGEKREGGAHWQGRNRPEIPADVRTSDEEFEQPGGPIRGEKGRGERGGCRVLIGVVLMAITREKSTGGVTPVTISRNGERGRRLWEEGDNMRGPPVSVRRRGCRYPFEMVRCWASGRIWGWAKWSPSALLSFSLIPFHIPFLISYFLLRFCKIPSNQIEQKSKFF
jgi:hypothetical protein